MTDINPALPDSFWAKLQSPGKREEYEALGVALLAYLPEELVRVMTRSERKRALGAICLLGWFTHWDLKLLHWCYDMLEVLALETKKDEDLVARMPEGHLECQKPEKVFGLISRIQALLQPEEEKP